MNKQERECLHRLQRVLDEIAKMEPSNPMDLLRKAVGCDLATKAARQLYLAIFSIGTREWAEAHVHLIEAERVVSQRAAKIAELEKRLQQQEPQ